MDTLSFGEVGFLLPTNLKASYAASLWLVELIVIAVGFKSSGNDGVILRFSVSKFLWIAESNAVTVVSEKLDSV